MADRADSGACFSFEFSLQLPSDWPEMISVNTKAAVSTRIVATLLGSASLFSTDVADAAWLFVINHPSLKADAAPFERHLPIETPTLGPGSVHLCADVCPVL